MKYGLFDGFSFLEMLHYDALEQLGSDMPIPYTFRIYDNDWASRTNTKTWCLTTFHAGGTEQKSLSLQQRRKERIKRTPPSVW